MFPSVFDKNSEYSLIKSDIEREKLPMGIIGLSNIHKAHYISSLLFSLRKKGLIICDSEGAAFKFAEDLGFFGVKALFFPRREFVFDTSVSPSLEFQRRRLGVLAKIVKDDFDCVVTTLEAAALLTIPKKELQRRSIILSVGDEISQKKLVMTLLRDGYGRSELVENAGQFSMRGEIVDFFPPESEFPIRIEFWGDEINQLSYFDPNTQRRTDLIEKVEIVPSVEVVADGFELKEKILDYVGNYKRRNAAAVKEKLLADVSLLQSGVSLPNADKYISLIFDEKSTLFDYFSSCLLFVAESRSARLNFENFSRELDLEIKYAKSRNDLAPGLDEFCLSFKSIVEYYELFGAIFIDNFERGRFDTQKILSLHRINDARTSAVWNGTIAMLEDELSLASRREYRVCIVAGNEKMAKNTADSLCDSGREAMYYPSFPEKLSSSTIAVIPGSLSGSFEYEYEKFMLIAYRRGAVQQSNRPKREKRAKGSAAISVDEIKEGDYVVHVNYGIGIFKGIVTKTVENVKSDYLAIQYSDGELFVPVDKIHFLTRYMSPESADREIKLNSFSSTKAWERTKSRAKESVREVARELASVYSQRLSEIGHSFGPDDDLQSLFEMKFEFEETEDQLAAIGEVKRDMQSVHPMDRLLLGDVGYGKTEVALRGVFKCVEEGKQCAILVPTTILALQHYQTMVKRFEGFPVTIEMLSRFRTSTQKTKIKKDLRNGVIDVIVGTHGLISDNVAFKDLGLLVVDEEQRFGVKQKEKIKKKFPLVDVLTISATPIPRTLNMAISGIRDMSVLEMPPQDRHPVQTFVLEQDMSFLSKVMEREINRGGQVYYLHNRVDSIQKKADEIAAFLPNARIGIGHGKMNEEELSEVWRSLLDGEIDILVCTTIIETGVDVPNVNTLIVEEANRLGLAQLHQIRGRVGRSARRAYAYFTFMPYKTLTPTAESRLEAIEQYTSFGAGYQIAMRDLEIRGAGEILGTQQHGHMAAVGYDMYIRMLNEAVEELGEIPREKPRPPCRIQISIDMSLPDTYIQSYANRIEIYKRILAIDSTEDARDVLDEVVDRFGNEMRSGKNTGSAPKCVIDLIKFSELKARATKQKINEIRQSGRYIVVYADKISVKHAMLMKTLYGDRCFVGMEGFRQCMKVPLKGSMQVLLVIERVVKVFEDTEEQ